jgi:thiamine biosynthesis lipoprotein
MGTTASVTVLGMHRRDRDSRHLAAEVIGRLAELERLWSRFLPDSDVTRINNAAGTPVQVDPRTAELVTVACRASVATGGLFSPLVGTALTDIGYRDPWQRGWATTPVQTTGPDYRPHGAETVTIEHTGTVLIPNGARLDLGGIAKGRAADLTAAWLNEQHGIGAIVNIGGDIRVITTCHDQAVTVNIDDPDTPNTQLISWSLYNGGVATSSTRHRRWTLADGRPTHHLIDPTTGQSTLGPRYASVVAGSATDAEILTKVAIVGGTDAARGWATGSIRITVEQHDGERVLLTNGTTRPLPAQQVAAAS